MSAMTLETMANDLRMALDPVCWAESLGLTLDSWQRDFVRSDARQIIAACGRQTGKSLACSLVASHTTTFEPGALVVLVAPSLRQSQLLISEVRDLLRRSGAVSVDAESTTRLQLGNGSKVVSVPGSGDTIRGISGVRLLICDEAAFIDPGVFQAVLPMLAANPRGRLILASSPNGRGGFFSDMWHDGGDAWQRFHVRSEDCPRIDQSFLERQRLALTLAQYRQEYLASFEDSAGAVFSGDDLAKMHAEAVIGWEL